MPTKQASGQILVLVLLVVLVGMSIGLSIAARTLSNLRDTTSLNLSNRAFNNAEAGIEQALLLLKSNPDTLPCSVSAPCTTPLMSGVDALKVVVDPIGENDRAFGLDRLKRDDVIQVNLDGYGASQLQVYWGDNKDDCPDTPAIVVSAVYKISGSYSMVKSAFDECPEHNNNFSTAAQDAGSDSVTLQDGTPRDNYRYKQTLDFSTGDLKIPSGGQLLLVRIRVMYGGATSPIAIKPVGSGVNLPAQGQQITSTAKAGDTQRTVKVVRSNTNLPAIFDYALFNGSTQPLTKN